MTAGKAGRDGKWVDRDGALSRSLTSRQRNWASCAGFNLWLRRFRVLYGRRHRSEAVKKLPKGEKSSNARVGNEQVTRSSFGSFLIFSQLQRDVSTTLAAADEEDVVVGERRSGMAAA
jgi:hypothetical protein